MSADQDGRGVPVPIVVTGCRDCPMVVYSSWTCRHPARTVPESNSAPSENNPDWCPLRSNPALVVLRTEVPK